MEVVYYLSCGMKSKHIVQITGVSRLTISHYRKALEEVLNEKFMQDEIQIGGENTIIEADESLIGHRKYNRGRVVPGVWILGFVKRTPERHIIMIPVERRDKVTITAEITKYVRRGSIIMTDKWGGYVGLNEYGYQHMTVNHSTNIVDPITGAHTQSIESNWGALKQTIPRRHRNKKNVWFYLLLFMFKRNWGNEFAFNLINTL